MQDELMVVARRLRCGLGVTIEDLRRLWPRVCPGIELEGDIDHDEVAANAAAFRLLEGLARMGL